MFALANRNNTFVTAELKSGPVTIIAGSCAGPYSESEMTDTLAAKINRGVLSKIDIPEAPKVTRRREPKKEENQEIEITEDENEL